MIDLGATIETRKGYENLQPNTIPRLNFDTSQKSLPVPIQSSKNTGKLLYIIS